MITEPEQLLNHNCLVYQAPKGAQKWHFRRTPRDTFHALELHGNLKGNHSEYLLQAALRGQGVVLFASWLVGHLIASGELVQILPAYEWAIDPTALVIHAVFPSIRKQSLKTRSFLDYLQQRIGTPAYWDVEVGPISSA